MVRAGEGKGLVMVAVMVAGGGDGDVCGSCTNGGALHVNNGHNLLPKSTNTDTLC